MFDRLSPAGYANESYSGLHTETFYCGKQTACHIEDDDAVDDSADHPKDPKIRRLNFGTHSPRRPSKVR